LIIIIDEINEKNMDAESLLANLRKCITGFNEMAKSKHNRQTHLTEGNFLLGLGQKQICKRNNRQGFNFRNYHLPSSRVNDALMLAHLSNLAYTNESPGKISTHRTSCGREQFKSVRQIRNSRTSTQGFIATNDKCLVIAFRGSETNIFDPVAFFKDWFLTDFNYRLVDVRWGGPRAKVHAGFRGALDSVYNVILNYLRDTERNKPLYITGHSLGGALATLLTYRLRAEGEWTNLKMFTFGAPPVGDSNFVRTFERKSIESYNIVNQNDPVSDPRCCLADAMKKENYALTPRVYLLRGPGHQIGEYIKQLSRGSNRQKNLYGNSYEK
jgi:triacylglycerol lipase